MRQRCEGSGQLPSTESKHRLSGLCPVCRQSVRLDGEKKLEAHDEM